MKKILYIYMGHYKGKQWNLEINFNQEYRFSYCEDKKEIKVTYNEAYFEGFYGEHIMGLSCLVGENGSGKTTLLKYIGDYLDQPFSPGSEFTITIYMQTNEGNDEIICSYSGFGLNKYKLKWNVDSIFDPKHNFNDPVEYYDNKNLHTMTRTRGLGNLYRIFFTSQIDNKLEVKNKSKNNLSNKKKDLSADTFDYKKVINCYSILKQLSKKNYFTNVIPDYIYIKNLESEDKDLYKSNFKYLFKCNNYVLKPYLHLLGESLYEKLFFDKDILDPDLLKRLNEIVSLKVKDDNHAASIKKDLEKLFNEVIYFLQDNERSIFQNYYYELFKSVKKLIVAYESIDSYEFQKVSFELTCDDSFLEIISTKFECAVIPVNQLIRDIWAFVTGFEEVKNDIKDGGYESIILLLDEPNNNFHPKMQLHLISIYLEILKYYYNDTKIKFQVILTTHSPLILTEILSEDVIILNQSINVKTFGANAFSLYYDVYNIEQPQGNFFLYKYDRIVKELENTPKDKKCNSDTLLEARRVYDSISEGIYKEYLGSVLEKYNNNETIYDTKKDYILNELRLKGVSDDVFDQLKVLLEE